MPLTLYAASIPQFRQALLNLSNLLKKGEEYAGSRKIDDSVLTSARLFPDMFPLARQVQIASDTVKGGAARLAGVELPSFPDTEVSFAELQERIAKTIAFLDSLREEQFEGSERRQIRIKAGPRELEFKGQDYLLSWVLPNLYFHVCTAYNILRHNGVEIGKRDFLGG